MLQSIAVVQDRKFEGFPAMSQYIDSYYAATAVSGPQSTTLQGDIEADVCIIGGGFTGVSAALHLTELGYDVVLLEAEKIAWGASGRNGGHVGVGQRKGQRELVSMVGNETAHTLWDYGLEAVGLVRSICENHNIDCDLKQGVLHVAAKLSHVDDLRLEAKHLRSAYGYDKIRFVDRDETANMVGSSNFYAGQLDGGSLHLHPLNFALGIATAAEKAGASIFQDSRVTSFSTGSTCVAITREGSVRAKFMVVGCNGYLERLNSTMAAKIMPINNFLLATEPLRPELAKSLIRDDVAVQDSKFVINYWKLSGDNRLLFGGGENYTKRFPTDMKSFVRKYMLRIYPQLEATRIDYAWGGMLAVTMNRLPSYGRLADNVFYAQGYSGHGIPTATMAGKLIAEAVSGDASRFDVMADLPVSRFPGGVFLRWPGLVAGMLYHSLKDRI